MSKHGPDGLREAQTNQARKNSHKPAVPKAGSMAVQTWRRGFGRER